uniref:Polynucleotide 5'-hydroxyl-kinase NOL9 n=1 Tax=Salarias fasciatus TaxID=181472 RepID=A0A672HW74_SALFA
MKANKNTHAKGKSQKWKDVRGKRCRPPISSSDLGSTPVVSTVVKEQQQSRKKKQNVKRLKSKVKPVSDNKINTPESGFKKSYPQANGSSAFTLDNESDDSQDWKEYSHSAYGNGVKTSDDTQDVQPGRLEGEALHHCAQRDDRQNRAVLIMQLGQVRTFGYNQACVHPIWLAAVAEYLFTSVQTLCFRGKCLVTCLYGRVEVMGFTIEEGQQPYPLFSPASHSPLTIRSMQNPDDTRDDRTEASVILQQYLSAGKQLTSCLSVFFSLFSFFMKVNKVRKPCVVLTGEMEGSAVILVCGAKNVGKSTFIRILINTLLNHTTSVDYLEGDLGQTEFTPAGCLSLTSVKEPLLGPPFTHQHSPEHMVYYGQSSCESDLDRYLESLKSLWRRRSQSRDAAVVINTMGWVKGFGFQLLVDMIRFFPVSHVLQLSHGGVNQFPALTPEFLRTAHGYQTHPPAQTALDEFTESHSPPRSYSHLVVQSEFQGAGRQGTARHQRTNELRELSLLGYLSQLQSSDSGPVRPLHSLTPYQVPHTAVALGVVHCDVVPSHMFYAANASLVGLCCLAEKVSSRGGPVLLSQAPICPCVGFGVLRGIDMARGLYLVLTPVDPSVLRKVNCLLLGGISLPSCILTKQPGIEGEMPYVTSDYSFELTGAGKLRTFKGLIRPGHLGAQ